MPHRLCNVDDIGVTGSSSSSGNGDGTTGGGTTGGGGNGTIFWSSTPPGRTGQPGSTVTVTNVRANYIDLQGTTNYGVGAGTLTPQITAFNYDFASDTMTAVVGTQSGTVLLQLFSGTTVVDTVDWPITVS